MASKAAGSGETGIIPHGKSALAQDWRQRGAGVVINLRYVTTSVIASTAELPVYGTAVKLSE